jgi:ADP-ribosyl-[dinitrogen reductase] hydrolase
MPHLFRVDRVRGCLLGLAVGDALGAPLEGLSPQQIKTHYGRVTNYVDGVAAWRRKPHRWRMRGLYTDDTQQALALCDVLLDCRHVDQERLADLYLGLMTPKGPFSGAHRGIGRSFRQVLSSLEQGVPAHLAGQPSAGIGAAMRIAPVALYFGDETGLMFDSVMAASLMTHRDIRSLSGALAVAHGVRRLAAGEPREASLLFRVAADVVRDEARIAADFGVQVLKFDRHAGGLARAIAHAEGLLDLPLEQALASLVIEANRHGADPVCRRATMGFPPACIPTCFYVLMTTESYEEALTEIINLGGDTDTSAAILGALAGAHYGVDAIPERWLDGLQNREGIDAWAIALAHRSRRGIHIPDLISTERWLTQKEGENFEAFASVTRTVDEGDGDDHRLL